MGLTSREEDILRATIDGTEYTEPPMSRVEELLIELKEAIEEGGGGTGSVVTITPTLESGEKIADYSINGVAGALYAPEGGGGGSGSGGKEVSKYLPETYKSDLVCEATLDNFDSTSQFWGEGVTPVRFSGGNASIQDGAVFIPVKTDAVFAYVDRECADGKPFTAYIVAKVNNPDQYSRIISTLYAHRVDNGILLSGNPIMVSAWADDSSTGESSSNYFVGVIQYSRPGLTLGKVNDSPRYFKRTEHIGQEIVIGRTDINPAGGDEEPSDIYVKYFAVVDNDESITAIEKNVASLMERFNIS